MRGVLPLNSLARFQFPPNELNPPSLLMKRLTNLVNPLVVFKVIRNRNHYTSQADYFCAKILK